MSLAKDLKVAREERLAKKNELAQIRAAENMNDEQAQRAETLVDEINALNTKITRFEKIEAADIASPEDVIDIPEKDLKRYSLARVVDAQINRRALDGLEGEIDKEYRKLRPGKTPQGNYMPPAALMRNITSEDSPGAISKSPMFNQYIEYLRQVTLVGQLGARFIPDMTGVPPIPKQTAKATAYHFNTKSSTAPETTPKIDQIETKPVTIGAYTVIDRDFLKQAGLGGEMWVQDELNLGVAEGWDQAVFSGGAVPTPNGVLDIATDVSDPDDDIRKSVIAAETQVAQANALRGNPVYVLNPLGRGNAKNYQLGTSGRFLMDMDNRLNGYDSYVTNNLFGWADTERTVKSLDPLAVFGVFSDILLLFWGGIDLFVNPYEYDTSGKLKITVMQDYDIVIRHDESFARFSVPAAA